MKELIPRHIKTEKIRSKCYKLKKTLRSKGSKHKLSKRCVKIFDDFDKDIKQSSKDLKEMRAFYQLNKNKINGKISEYIKHYFYDVYDIEYIYNKFYTKWKRHYRIHKPLFKDEHIKEIQKLYGKTSNIKQHIKNAVSYLVYMTKNKKEFNLNLDKSFLEKLEEKNKLENKDKKAMFKFLFKV